MRLIYAIAFAGLYAWQLVRSTGYLAYLVIRPRLDLHPRFVDVPLDLRGEMPRFLFACLVTMTPGSLSVGIDRERDVLVVHLIDAPDPEAAIIEQKRSLEIHLIRIFGGVGKT